VKNWFQVRVWSDGSVVLGEVADVEVAVDEVDANRACFRMGDRVQPRGWGAPGRRLVRALLLVVVRVWKRQIGRDATVWEACFDVVEKVEKLAAGVAVARVILVPIAAERDECTAMRRTAVVVL